MARIQSATVGSYEYMNYILIIYDMTFYPDYASYKYSI